MSQPIIESQRMYKSQSGSPGLTPPGLTSNVFSKAVTPPEVTLQPNAHHVLINNSGSYHFIYTGGASSMAIAANYTLGIKVGGDPDGSVSTPVRLDINPCAWSGSGDHYTGDVTFVYRGH